MKIEFPFLAMVLAAGCLLWGGMGFRSNTALQAGTERPPVPGNGQDSSIGYGNGGVSGAEPGGSQFTDSTDGDQLLRQAAAILFQSVPIQAAARLRLNLFEQQLVAQGRYFQMGQGSGRARLEFVFGDNSRPQTIHQICDGRFYYRYDSLDAEANLQVANLSKFAESDRQLLFADASTWMATGGLSSLLEILANNFEFEPAVASQVGDTPVLVIKGAWKPDRIRRLLMGQIDHSLIQEEINWNRLPAQIPQRVEITLGNDAFFPLFPYRLRFFRGRQTKAGIEEVNIATMELYELTRNAELAEEIFVVESGVPPQDLTRDFVDRIQNLNYAIRSASDQQDSNPHR